MTNLVEGRRIEIVRGQAGGELADVVLLIGQLRHLGLGS
jgi:hypothetical protein